MTKEIIKEKNNVFFLEIVKDEQGRIVSETYPVDKNGECPEGYELEITTTEYEYDNNNTIPSKFRYRGWAEGCFWTEWENY